MNDWYKDAILYELQIKSFCDVDGDGIGDFAGLLSKLDYLQRLGVTCLWITPFYPSPLRDDGYDIADYMTIDPAYGLLGDFQRVLDVAHEKGIRVITDMVMNHTSDQHRWFQAARRGDPQYRDYYVWSKTQDKYRDARIIFLDTEPSNWTMDALAGEYFWHRFFDHQPDLNYDNPAVHDEMLRVVDHWLKMGLDGFRADAVPYLYEREGTNCENLPETHAFLKKLRRHIDEHFPGRILLAEANQWPQDVLPYFGEPDAPEFHMAFNFPVMPRLYMALAQEDSTSIIDIMQQMPTIPPQAQWCTFLRNHDELTLEMVTPDERDYLWRTYAPDPRMKLNLGIRRRLAPLLGNDRRKLELLNGLLFALPGAPIIYYGDEIGMGDNIWLRDRNGVRTPMQWSSDANAGFSRASRDRLYTPAIDDAVYGYQAVNVAAQEAQPHSLLNWMRSLIAARKAHPVLARGTLAFVDTGSPKVLAFVRHSDDETLIGVFNLAGSAQAAEIDLSAYAGRTPVDVFGGSRLPRISSSSYALTLSAYAFYWLALRA
jgi:maltose alpha-D-glucosyltransferase/alpha-amylase